MQIYQASWLIWLFTFPSSNQMSNVTWCYSRRLKNVSSVLLIITKYTYHLILAFLQNIHENTFLLSKILFFNNRKHTVANSFNNRDILIVSKGIEENKNLKYPEQNIMKIKFLFKKQRNCCVTCPRKS